MRPLPGILIRVTAQPVQGVHTLRFAGARNRRNKAYQQAQIVVSVCVRREQQETPVAGSRSSRELPSRLKLGEVATGRKACSACQTNTNIRLMRVHLLAALSSYLQQRNARQQTRGSTPPREDCLRSPSCRPTVSYQFSVRRPTVLKLFNRNYIILTKTTWPASANHARPAGLRSLTPQSPVLE